MCRTSAAASVSPFFIANGGIAPRELWRRLSQTGLPALWIPKCDDIFQVTNLPLLGTGKLDLRAIKAQAVRLMEGSGNNETAVPQAEKEES